MSRVTGKKDRVLALSGGVGGAKLALGLSRIVPRGKLTVVANTGDDFEYLGLPVSPDIDTLLYTLAGLDNPRNGVGSPQRKLDVHGGACRIGRGNLVSSGRRRSGYSRRANPQAHAGERLSQIARNSGQRSDSTPRLCR